MWFIERGAQHPIVAPPIGDVDPVGSRSREHGRGAAVVDDPIVAGPAVEAVVAPAAADEVVARPPTMRSLRELPISRSLPGPPIIEAAGRGRVRFRGRHRFAVLHDARHAAEGIAQRCGAAADQLHATDDREEDVVRDRPQPASAAPGCLHPNLPRSVPRRTAIASSNDTPTPSIAASSALPITVCRCGPLELPELPGRASTSPRRTWSMTSTRTLPEIGWV